MSKHVCTLEMAGAGSVRVELGFDRALGGFYMTVADGAGASDGFVYDSGLDPVLLDQGGLPTDVMHFMEVLKRLQIALPSVIFEEVQLDSERSVGSKIAIYDSTGQVIGGTR
ncbi:MAG: hypothetical protein E6R08_00660 [Nevskiaceae bacterium]|nr:MAG: hypothetical protein E6R08_00660 [Nevskiaceae bacterium]